MDEDLKLLVHSASEEVLMDVIADPELDEDDLLVLLARRDLSGELLRRVARDPSKTKSYRVRLALLRHPRTPASAALAFVGQLHLFDMVAVSLLPHVPREIKAAAEGTILQQLKQIPLGAKVTLARRTGATVVIGRLLLDREMRVVEAVLRSSRRHGLDPYLVTAVLLVESDARPWAESGKGAIGLMQVMPHMAEKLSLAGNLATIESNIEAGCFILADNIERLGEAQGISSYFWGRNIRGREYLEKVERARARVREAKAS